MEKKNNIDTLKMVREIRDQQAKILEDKSDDEIIEFFKNAGKALKQKNMGDGQARPGARL